MVDMENAQEGLQAHFRQVLDLLQQCRMGLQESTEQDSSLAAIELRSKLEQLHSADIAYILEALPIDQRLQLWDFFTPRRDGGILLELSDAVRESLMSRMDSEELLAATEQLHSDEIADLAPNLPTDVLQELLTSLDVQNRERVQAAMSYPDDRVGALMDFDIVTIRGDISLEVALRYLRRIGNLPDHTDKLFVVDRQDHVLGVLPLKKLVVYELDVTVASVMIDDVVFFHPDDEASDAAQAFERYDLVSAPVVDESQRLVGRLTVNAVMDFIREETEGEVLSLGGLRREEDIFAPIWKSLQNRWIWLLINLITAFVSSRVISVFEGSIEKVVALAALMPIVAGIGGNSGNQTITMIVRGLALGQITPDNRAALLFKETGVALLNGLIWGGLLSAVVYLLYHDLTLSLVMIGAMTLNLVLAGLVGVWVPFLMDKLNKDPAMGSSVMITAVTDSGGFFIFLGLATLFLV